MRPRIGLMLVVLLSTACGGVLYNTTTTMTGRAPDDVFQCTEEQFRALGYRRVAHDVTDRRLVGERTDPTIKVSSGLFRRGFHRLTVLIRPDASGNTAVEVKAQTFKAFDTAGGTVLEEEKVHTSGQLDARKLATACVATP